MSNMNVRIRPRRQLVDADELFKLATNHRNDRLFFQELTTCHRQHAADAVDYFACLYEYSLIVIARLSCTASTRTRLTQRMKTRLRCPRLSAIKRIKRRRQRRSLLGSQLEWISCRAQLGCHKALLADLCGSGLWKLIRTLVGWVPLIMRNLWR